MWSTTSSPSTTWCRKSSVFFFGFLVAPAIFGVRWLGWHSLCGTGISSNAEISPRPCRCCYGFVLSLGRCSGWFMLFSRKAFFFRWIKKGTPSRAKVVTEKFSSKGPVYHITSYDGSELCLEDFFPSVSCAAPCLLDWGWGLDGRVPVEWGWVLCGDEDWLYLYQQLTQNLVIWLDWWLALDFLFTTWHCIARGLLLLCWFFFVFVRNRLWPGFSPTTPESRVVSTHISFFFVCLVVIITALWVWYCPLLWWFGFSLCPLGVSADGTRYSQSEFWVFSSQWHDENRRSRVKTTFFFSYF